MSIFGDSRLFEYFCQNWVPSENQFFFNEGVMGHQSVMEVLDGQDPGLYGGTILGGLTHLGGSGGDSCANGPFFYTFLTALRVFPTALRVFGID